MEEVSFRQVVSRGCGIDVHQKVAVATIGGEALRTQTREFGTTTSSLTEMKEWLLGNGITHVAMESTGVYWKPVYNILEPSGIKVWIVNARHIKYVPGHKTDKQDSAWILKLLLAGLLKPSYVPPKAQRELRDLTRYRNKLVQNVASEKNRIIRILEDCNIKLSSVMSSTSGVTATKLIDKLCDGKIVTREDIDEVYHGKLQCSKDDLYEACQGFITDHHIFLLQAIKRDIESTESIISELSARIKESLSEYDNAMEVLRGIPGLNRKTVEDLIAEIGLDMSVFPTEKHLASWAGMCPGNNESAGKKKSGGVTHGNKQVKAVITEAAWAATRTKNTFYSARYHRLAARRGKKRALIAVGHSILKSVYHVLSGVEEYKELGADYVNQRVEKRRRLYLKRELEKLGYDVQLTQQERQAG
ncbi:IS110 family transposase [Methanosarcina sp.]|uniref:IS110 family transposase n=1 Tax=Methanosarcina sp. TaxID=2213 RepID=UPI002C4872F2|nr:IS110 family transposase [Methanosarcina sp.]HOW16074.1 IS110 family transposase [Methanosarcina sp.]